MIVYLLGIFVPTHRTNPERLYIALFQKGGDPSLIVSNVAEKYLKLKGPIDDVTVYTEYQESPIEILVNLMKHRRLETRKIGIEMGFLTVLHYRELIELSPKTRFADCSSFFGKIRMIKDKEEISLLRELAIVTEKSIEQSFEMTHPNDSAETLKCNAISAIGNVGADHINFCIFDWMSSAISTKENRREGESSQPAERKALVEGDLVKIDLSGNFKGVYVRSSEVSHCG